MPSPTSTTVPTLRVSVAASNESIDDLMMLVISSERMAMRRSPGRRLDRARGELVAKSFEAAADAAIDQAIADADHQPAEQALVDSGLQGDPTSRHLLESSGQSADLDVGERRRACCRGVDDPLAGVIEPPELCRDAADLLDPTALDEEEDEVAGLLGQPVEDLADDGPALVER